MKCSRVFLPLAVVSAWGADTCLVRGRVINAITAEPLSKAQVTLRSRTNDNSSSVSADGTGTYSLAVATGQYELLVKKRGFVPRGTSMAVQGTGTGWSCPAPADSQGVSNAVIRLMPQAVITGRIADSDGEPIPGVTVQAIQSHGAGAAQRYSVAATATTNDLGEYRLFGLASGRYYLGAAYRSEAGFAAAYFPGVQDASRAAPIDVRAGGEANGVNLALPDLRSLKIAGVLRGPGGPAAEGIMIVAAPCDAGPLNRSTTTVKGGNGAFAMRDLAPGCYVLAADWFSGGKRYSARMPLNMGENNLDDVHLNLLPPVQLTGKVKVVDGDERQVRQVVVNIQARASKLTAGGAAGEDGSFQLNNVVPEVYDLSVALPDGYYLKSARAGDTDVLQAGLDMSHGGSGPLNLEISGAAGRIEGSVVDGSGGPVAGAQVVVIPENTSHSGRAPSKFAVTNEEGNFQVRGIAPGDYRIYSSPDLDAMALQDAADAGQLEGWKKKVSVAEHGRETVVVKAIASETSR
jgi:protocatechuate 3,4-dioxygenase beta subunit